MYATQDTTEVSIGEYLDVLRRRWIWILLAPVVLVSLSLFHDLRAQPVYSAQVQMLLQSSNAESFFNPTPQVADPARALQNEIKIINSRTVKLAVEKAYGQPVSISAFTGGEDDIILISARGNTGRLAAERANIYATTYQSVRLEALVKDITDAKDILQQQIDDFQKQIDKINAPLAAIDDQLKLISSDDPKYAALLQQRDQLKSQTQAARDAAQNQLSDYEQRFQVLQVSERLNTTGGVQILNPATVPGSPIAPTTTRNAIQAIIIGAFLGIGLAFLRDQVDDSLRTKADVERAVKDIPTIGLVPLDVAWKDERTPHLATLAAPMSASAEAYRGLRTAIQYAGLERPINVIQITSPSAGEGKSSLLSNIAVAFAQAGKRVAVVGCDLRKPRLHQFFEVDGTPGFTSVVLGDITLKDAMQTSPLHPNIDVLASGPLPPNPSELLSHERTGRIIQSLAETYTVVFIDCPPVLPVTDALVLARQVDATLLLATANKTTRRTARRAAEMLRQVGTPLLGTVFNGVAAEDTYGSLYEYYGYETKSRVPIIGRWLNKRHAAEFSASMDVLPRDEAAPDLEDEPAKS